jgi:hypothetical protein
MADRPNKAANDKRYKERHRSRINAKRRAEYAADPEVGRARLRTYRAANYEKVIRYNRLWLIGYRARLKAEMIAAYGGACACCRETIPAFLQLDHIYNDGAADRLLNKTSAKLWAKLKREGWPKERHQLLCANCNFGKLMNNGVCPHQEMAHGR